MRRIRRSRERAPDQIGEVGGVVAEGTDGHEYDHWQVEIVAETAFDWRELPGELPTLNPQTEFRVRSGYHSRGNHPEGIV